MRLLITAAVLAVITLSGCSKDDQPEAVTRTVDRVVDKVVNKVVNDERFVADPFRAEADKAALGISGAYIREVVAEISDDSYGGRGPGSEGDTMTQEFLSKQLASFGFEPGNNGSWTQPFDLVGVTTEMPDDWTFTRDDESVSFSRGDEFAGGSGKQQDQVSINNAEVVFVGYGIEAPEYDWNDFKGMDLTGKVLLMLNNDPDWDDDLFEGKRRLLYGRWTYKYESAARQGAAATIIIHTVPSAGYPWAVVRNGWSGEQFELPAGDEPRTNLNAWVTEDAAKRLVALAGKDLGTLVESAKSRDFRPVPLDVTTSLTASTTLTRNQSANVIGILKGSDPELADEAIIYTAHHDHIGIAEPDGTENQDRIYNGARDNATGTAMILSAAKAFSELPTRPKRSIVVAFVGAEEQGLLGSKYYSEHPTVAPGKLAANVNLDSGNIWGETKDIVIVGKGKSSLDDVADKIAARYKRTVKPDQFPDRGYFYRSDQYNLARIGVPALYLRGGVDYVGRPDGWGKETLDAYTARHYHQPSDELTDDWDFSGLVLDAQFAFWAGYIVANTTELPAWNKGDEFEAARIEALSKVD